MKYDIGGVRDFRELQEADVLSIVKLGQNLGLSRIEEMAGRGKGGGGLITEWLVRCMLRDSLLGVVRDYDRLAGKLVRMRGMIIGVTHIQRDKWVRALISKELKGYAERARECVETAGLTKKQEGEDARSSLHYPSA